MHEKTCNGLDRTQSRLKVFQNHQQKEEVNKEPQIHGSNHICSVTFLSF